MHPLEDKETISVDQVREVIESVSLTAHRGKAKVVIIEPAEAMTTAAANALLKTLEEPSGDSYLLLLSHQPGRLTATIRSRCQRHRGRPAPASRSRGVARRSASHSRRAAATGDSPLEIAAAVRRYRFKIKIGLQNDLIGISLKKIDPLAVANAWLKQDCDGFSAAAAPNAARAAFGAGARFDRGHRSPPPTIA